MKKHYKTKPKNITKLKIYINATQTDNKGDRGSKRSHTTSRNLSVTDLH